MKVVVKVKGENKLLDKLSASKRRKYFGEATDKSLLTIHKEASIYPPQRPGSSYRRTNTLGRRWEIQPFGGQVNEFGGRVVNDTEYGPYVMGPDDQADVHKGTWRTTDKIMEDVKNKIVGFYKEAIKKLTG